MYENKINSTEINSAGIGSAEASETSVLSNGLIWFGAGVSIAEIMTGTYFASMGFKKGFFAIILGHLIGCAILFFAGLIGAKERKSAMECGMKSFGRYGSGLFTILNIMQLVGWTAIMIYDGSQATESVFGIGRWIWCIVIGVLIIIWNVIDAKFLEKVNIPAVTALFILAIILTWCIISGKGSFDSAGADSLSFGSALELSISMPLSWLPLIGDYTSGAKKPVKTTFVSAIVYFFVSTWMYVIGMGSAILTGESDVAKIMLKAGLGIAAMVIVILSTVTTTYLDVFSAGMSLKTLIPKGNKRIFACAVAIIGLFGAIFLPLYDITDFLYFIGSVFTPMFAIEFADMFIIKKDSSNKKFDWAGLIIWICGFVLYRVLMKFYIVIGNTVIDIIFTIIVCIAVDKLRKLVRK